jgi:hypothetical protein
VLIGALIDLKKSVPVGPPKLPAAGASTTEANAIVLECTFAYDTPARGIF